MTKEQYNAVAGELGAAMTKATTRRALLIGKERALLVDTALKMYSTVYKLAGVVEFLIENGHFSGVLPLREQHNEAIHDCHKCVALIGNFVPADVLRANPVFEQLADDIDELHGFMDRLHDIDFLEEP